MAKSLESMTQCELAEVVCEEDERADGFASAHDGDVPRTWEVMDEHELARFFRAAYLLARAVRVENLSDA